MQKNLESEHPGALCQQLLVDLIRIFRTLVSALVDVGTAACRSQAGRCSKGACLPNMETSCAVKSEHSGRTCKALTKGGPW